MLINTDEWLTAAEAEKKYNHFAGYIRQEIRRKHLQEPDVIKIGNTWLVKIEVMEKKRKGD